MSQPHPGSSKNGNRNRQSAKKPKAARSRVRSLRRGALPESDIPPLHANLAPSYRKH